MAGVPPPHGLPARSAPPPGLGHNVGREAAFESHNAHQYQQPETGRNERMGYEHSVSSAGPSHSDVNNPYHQRHNAEEYGNPHGRRASDYDRQQQQVPYAHSFDQPQSHGSYEPHSNTRRNSGSYHRRGWGSGGFQHGRRGSGSGGYQHDRRGSGSGGYQHGDFDVQHSHEYSRSSKRRFSNSDNQRQVPSGSDSRATSDNTNRPHPQNSHSDSRADREFEERNPRNYDDHTRQKRERTAHQDHDSRDPAATEFNESRGSRDYNSRDSRHRDDYASDKHSRRQKFERRKQRREPRRQRGGGNFDQMHGIEYQFGGRGGGGNRGGGNGGGGRRQRPVKRTEQNLRPGGNLSRTLVKILRHKALELRLPIRPDGYVPWEAMMRLDEVNRFQPTIDDLKKIVAGCDKQRMSLEQIDGQLHIRANQGHSGKLEQALKADELMEPITDPSKYPMVVHGTYMKPWATIKEQGLSRMARSHVHFAPGDEIKGSNKVTSGFRSSSNVLIYIDLPRAMEEGGLKFYRSQNNVILTPGDANGFVSPRFFSKVLHCDVSGNKRKVIRDLLNDDKHSPKKSASMSSANPRDADEQKSDQNPSDEQRKGDKKRRRKNKGGKRGKSRVNDQAASGNNGQKGSQNLKWEKKKKKQLKKAQKNVSDSIMKDSATSDKVAPATPQKLASGPPPPNANTDS